MAFEIIVEESLHAIELGFEMLDIFVYTFGLRQNRCLNLLQGCGLNDGGEITER